MSLNKIGNFSKFIFIGIDIYIIHLIVFIDIINITELYLLLSNNLKFG